ncbi:tubulin polyglutamylase TTLL5-like [Liolophura sinensis]|uniref:tubulin polyglutamylase TTLL5-like n=1 Tax=Liolophura sinensis TaxID=3198878 RepID=UPI003158CA00
MFNQLICVRQPGPKMSSNLSGLEKRAICFCLSRSRPSSASSNKSGVRVINHRPASANSTKSVSAGKPPLERGYVDVYNEKAINEALQRLAHRQQARQYSATNSTVGFSEMPSNVPLYRSNSQQSIRTEVFRTRSLSTGDTSTTDMHKVQRHTNDRSHVHQPDAPQGKYITLEEHRSSLRLPSRPQVRAGSLKTANATFNSFIEDKGPSWQSDLALAYNQITGSSLNHFGVGSQGNRSYKVAQQQQLAKQQRMMAQSKALLESSKAKHLAMVAQAHAAQLPGTQGLMGSQASLSSETSTQPYEPKPPTRPVTGKKVNNHFRVARPLTLEVGAGGDKHINPDTFQLSSHLVSSSISGAKLLTQ